MNSRLELGLKRRLFNFNFTTTFRHNLDVFYRRLFDDPKKTSFHLSLFINQIFDVVWTSSVVVFSTSFQRVFAGWAWSGKNQEGAGSTAGEEVEQVNSYLSRCALTTKYMSKGGDCSISLLM